MQTLLDTSSGPSRNTKCVGGSKILGHQMAPGSIFAIYVNDWMEKRKVHGRRYRRIPINNGLRLIRSVIGSILLYGLTGFKLDKDNVGGIQRFYSRCIIEVTRGIKLYNVNDGRKQINK